MRPLKFRAWNKYHKKMHSVYEINFYHLIAKTRDENTGNTYTFGFIDLEIMQFTGLKDFFDTEIFEGDIVFLDSFMRNYEIVMDCGDWKMKNGDDYEWICDWYKDLHVIGNIYSNPDLLEN